MDTTIAAADVDTCNASTLVSMIRSLPPLPDVAQEIIARFQDEFISGNDIADIVSGDPTISARLFSLANSAYYGLQEPVSDMRVVVGRVLGPDAVRSLAFALATNRTFDLSACLGFDSDRFWNRALNTAAAAQRFSKVVEDLDPTEREFAYIAGLCHSLGLMALACSLPEKTSDVLNAHTEDDELKMEELCVGKLGYSIETVTHELVNHWKLPQEIVVAYQHRAEQRSADNKLASILEASIKASRQIEHMLSATEPTDLHIPYIAKDLPDVELNTLKKATVGTEAQRQATETTVKAMVG
ncbi:MAG: HDOD domain-containing protein [Pseudomonadota bacterium]